LVLLIYSSSLIYLDKSEKCLIRLRRTKMR